MTGRRPTLPADGYGPVLLTVVATVAWTTLAPATAWGWLLTLLLLTATLTGALRASLAGRRLRRACATLWTIAVLLAFGAGSSGQTAGVVAVLGVLLLAAALFAVLHRLTRQPEVSRQTVQAAVSAYLLIGLLFTFGYAAATQLGHHPLRGGGDDLSTCLYFSFVTLTTTGYGDVTAATDLARSLAILEALTGQLYLVTVLALAVGRLPVRRR